MSNQDIDGKVPPEAATGASGTPNGAPDTLEQQLAKEREERALMRDRLRTTEALAAESHALRARMAQELERVTADRDRLRTQAAAEAPPTSAPGPSPVPRSGAPRAVEPPLTPAMAPPRASHAADRPLKPPVPAGSKGPWGALAMLSVLAVAVAAVAWFKGSLPGARQFQAATAVAVARPATVATEVPAAPVAASAASQGPVDAPTASPSKGVVPLPALAPDAQLAVTPTAAGPATTVTPASLPPAQILDRLRKALDGEGIASPVDIDASTARVSVADPQADAAQRQRTDMLIRAVYAGASLPEPQIEHRWLSPMRGAHEATVSTGDPAEAAPAAEAPPAAATAAAPPATADTADTADTGRQAALPRAREGRPSMALSVADAEGLTPVLPSGRLTASCLEGLVGRSAARRANMTACMKHSCCSSAAKHNSEECRAYERAYPFTCRAG